MRLTELVEEQAMSVTSKGNPSDNDKLATVAAIRRQHIDALHRVAHSLDDSHEWPDNAAKELVTDLLGYLEDLVPDITSLR